MTVQEYRSWGAYHARYPFDDRHRYHRPAALIAKSGTTAPIGELIDWLQPKPTRAVDLSDADSQTLAAFGFKS